MKTPPLLLGASIIFWGWQTGLLLPAAIVALVLEGSRLVKSRLELSPSDFNRISDISALLLIGLVVYLFFQNRPAQAILTMLERLPLAFLPLLAAQVFSTSERIHIGAFFWTARKRGKKKGAESTSAIDLAYPYFALCILSAGAANVRTASFYVGLFSLSVWALWFARSRRFSPVLWITLMLFAGLLGYAGHIGLHNLQTVLEEKMTAWFTDFIRRDADPYRTKTAIGDIGPLKLSDRILFRVKQEPAYQHPILLREASYNTYRSTNWFAFHAGFKEVQPEADGATWVLQPGPGADKIITVYEYLRRGKGMLKLPNGAFQIAHLPVSQMKKNQYGAVKVEEGPGLINYRVRFNPHTSFEGAAGESDLTVPQKEGPAISKIVEGLKLTSKSPQEVLKSLTVFFQRNFGYSLILDSGGKDLTPLEDFLLRTRSGHCEYFATATVLLLRAAGIPARYATGYSVQEFDRMENLFVVRSRHAHAWTLVYIDGAWHDFDTTPPSWGSVEAETASAWEPISDLWSWTMFKFSEWRWREKKGGMTKHILWLLIPLIFELARRFFFKKRVIRLKTGQKKTGRVGVMSGIDSEFYMVEKRLTELGYMRHPWEPLSGWIKRIEEAQPSPVSTESLRSILNLHYRYRFDPRGITPDEKAVLKSDVLSWLGQNILTG